jgi:hypothetical protein
MGIGLGVGVDAHRAGPDFLRADAGIVYRPLHEILYLARPDAYFHQLILYVNDDGAFLYYRRPTEPRQILLYPFPSNLHARVRSLLVLTNGHRNTAVSATEQRISYQTRHRTHGGIDFGLSFLQQIEKGLRSGARECPHDCIHIFSRLRAVQHARRRIRRLRVIWVKLPPPHRLCFPSNHVARSCGTRIVTEQGGQDRSCFRRAQSKRTSGVERCGDRPRDDRRCEKCPQHSLSLGRHGEKRSDHFQQTGFLVPIIAFRSFRRQAQAVGAR